MEERSKVLLEALDKNEEEKVKWLEYKAEHKETIDAMLKYRDKLHVDVMVPLGPKAMVPGQLVNTNRVTVGHYSNYFTECTVQQAKSVCEYRIGLAEKKLNELEVERKLWMDKLECPLKEDAFEQEGQTDIIEEYNEEAEAKNKKRVKPKDQELADMLDEKLARTKAIIKGCVAPQPNKVNNTLDSDDDEELASEEVADMQAVPETGKLQIETDDDDEENDQKLAGEFTQEEQNEMIRTAEKLNKLMLTSDTGNAQIKLKEKNGYDIKKIKEKTDMSEQCKSEGKEKADSKDKHYKEATNKNNSSVGEQGLREEEKKDKINEQCKGNNTTLDSAEIGDEIFDDGDGLHLSERVQIIQENSKWFSGPEKMDFIEKQIQKLTEKMNLTRNHTSYVTDEKTSLMHDIASLQNIYYELLLDNENEFSSESEVETSDDSNDEEPTEEKPKHKRHVSFAKKEQELIFKKTDSVAEMLPNKNRDKVELWDKDNNAEEPMHTEIEVLENRIQILKDKAEKSKQIKHEKDINYLLASIPDYESAYETQETSYIHFKHSENEPARSVNTEDADNNIARTPGEIYTIYLAGLMKEQQKEQQVKTAQLQLEAAKEENITPVLKEQSRSIAYKDMRSEFSNPLLAKADAAAAVPENAAAKNVKSILRNKEAVHLEKRAVKKENQEKLPNKKRTLQPEPPIAYERSAFNTCVGEVVERTRNDTPDALPDNKFVNANAPKKRMSLFAKMQAAKKEGKSSEVTQIGQKSDYIIYG